MGALLAALATIAPDDWSLPSTIEGTGVHHGYRRSVVVEGGRLVRPAWREVLVEFEPVWSAWLSMIEPGGFILPHVDGGPYRERWQIPISTAGTMNGVEAVDGEPFRVRQWEPHRVDNPTDRPRIHLVIDRDVVLDIPTAPFRLMPEETAAEVTT